MPDRPRFIVFAGLDGSGKTTQAVRLGRESGYRYVWARWSPLLLLPARILFAKLVLRRRAYRVDEGADFGRSQSRKRRLLSLAPARGAWLAAAELDYLLQLAWKRAIGQLGRGFRVCDRYIGDFYIDQMINLGEEPERLRRRLRRRVLALFPRPDVLVYIAVTPETGAARKRDGTSVEYLRAREPYYQALCGIYPAVVVDGERDAETVYRSIRAGLGWEGGPP